MCKSFRCVSQTCVSQTWVLGLGLPVSMATSAAILNTRDIFTFPNHSLDVSISGMHQLYSSAVSNGHVVFLLSLFLCWFHTNVHTNGSAEPDAFDFSRMANVGH